MSRILNLFLPLIAGLLIANPLQAAVSWTFSQGNCTSGSAGCNVGSIAHGNTLNFDSNEAGGPSVTVRAYSSTDDVGGEDQNESGTLKIYGGGLGITSKEDGALGLSPHHAIDNNGSGTSNSGSDPFNQPDDDSANDNGDIDAVLFEFTQDVSLDSVGIGYKSGDADITVLAYTALGSPTLDAVTPTSLLSSGWELVGSYANLTTASVKAINTASKVASWWLVSAYNPDLDSKGWTFDNDYFKLRTLSAAVAPGSTPVAVPAPPTFFLLLLGVAVFNMRRKKMLDYGTLIIR